MSVKFDLLQYKDKRSPFNNHWQVLRDTMYFGEKIRVCLHKDGRWSYYTFNWKDHSEYTGFYPTIEEALITITKYYKIDSVECSAKGV